MPTTGGPCRFGQYRALHRVLLDEMGLQDVEIISPTAENSYQGFGEHPVQLRLLIWRGVVGADLLRKLRYEYRPYEVNAGETDALYYELLYALADAIETGSGPRAVSVMKEAARRFSALPVCREPRPIIGLVGEIYLRANDFTNQDIVRRIESLGGEVWVATLMEWFYFTNYGALVRARMTGDALDWLKTQAADLVQRRIEHEMLKPVASLLRNAHETPVSALMENDRPYYDPALGTESALSIGKAIDFAKLGLSGILHVLPLNCMPATTVTGIAPKVRQDLDRIPWLDITYDAQAITNINTRLEAFIYQAREYGKRRGEGETS
jgi:predicted nucleotide-binding protein (sugar kinase/HSP70/actin superfamily)